ncbi:hypothetical protein [Streptococcus sp. zg-JUN1979]|uniref:hypothetical protein n=1 Tax=Streptococcus sp. zg-JUN1979 TaxID=3391450 RepID=UPI0039A4E450
MRQPYEVPLYIAIGYILLLIYVIAGLSADKGKLAETQKVNEQTIQSLTVKQNQDRRLIDEQQAEITRLRAEILGIGG